jgi:hypothetical protein
MSGVKVSRSDATISIVIVAVSLFVLTSCSSQQETPVATYGASQDTITKWVEYAESSSEGLWEDLPEHDILVEHVRTFGGEEDLVPPFYTADFIDVSGDTLFVADECSQTLVCMGLDGNVFWTIGGPGEGPGYFSGIGRLSISDSCVAVCNNGLNAVDIFTREGGFLQRLSIAAPQDVFFIADSLIAVLSKAQPGGNVTLLDTRTGTIVSSFGDGDWTICPDNRAVRDLLGVFIPPSTIAYTSQFEYQLVIYNMITEQRIFIGSRILPAEPHPPSQQVDANGNLIGGALFPIVGNMFIGPEGTIDVSICGYMFNGEFLGPHNVTDYAPVTIIDRYAIDGYYLDSYAIPDSVLSGIKYEPGVGFLCRQTITEVVQWFRCIEGTTASAPCSAGNP